jgi:hypothetical protein
MTRTRIFFASTAVAVAMTIAIGQCFLALGWRQYSPNVILGLLTLICIATAFAPKLTDCRWFDLWSLLSILCIWLVLPLGAVMAGLFGATGLGQTELVTWRDLVHWWIITGVPIAMASILTDFYLQDLSKSTTTVTSAKWVIASWIGQLLFATIFIANSIKSEQSDAPQPANGAFLDGSSSARAR